MKNQNKVNIIKDHLRAAQSCCNEMNDINYQQYLEILNEKMHAAQMTLDVLNGEDIE